MSNTVPMDQAAEHYYDGFRRGVSEGKRQEMERILLLLKLDLKLVEISDPVVWVKRAETIIRTSAEA